MHVVKRKQDGEVLGMMRADKADVENVTEVYLDGTVRTGRGDTWQIKLAGGTKAARGAKWATVNPMHAE
jgi:hypothetical protein